MNRPGASAHPKGTPVDIVDKINKEINAGLADPKMKARLADLGGTPLPRTPAEFGQFIADETEKWGKVVKLWYQAGLIRNSRRKIPYRLVLGIARATLG